MVLRPAAAKIMAGILGLKFFAYLIWTCLRQDFLPALCDQTMGMVLITGLLCIGHRHVPQVTPAICIGLGTAVTGAAIQRAEWGLHEHFNHNDIYHVLGAITIWCFYLAGKKFEDYGNSRYQPATI